jgi:hypothetical protein
MVNVVTHGESAFLPTKEETVVNLANSIVVGWNELPDKPVRFSVRALIAQMLTDIESLISRGYSLKDVYELICEKGVEISRSLFERYYYALRKERQERVSSGAMAPSTPLAASSVGTSTTVDRKPENERKKTSRKKKTKQQPSSPAIAESGNLAQVEQRIDDDAGEGERNTNRTDSSADKQISLETRRGYQLPAEEMIAMGFNVSVRPNY